jgi:nitroreductase
MSKHPFIPYRPLPPPASPVEAARAFYQTMASRRSVRFFSDRPVPREVIEWVIRAAGTAPSGANKQPWRFVCISDPALKRLIRAAAEAEERDFYAHKANAEWLANLAPLETTPDKAFLETAPWLIAVFRLAHTDEGGQVYYPHESVGIAVGLLLAAAHHAGLATLTHTPSPMKFLSRILQRPPHERAYLLIPVGYPAGGKGEGEAGQRGCLVPDIHRHPLERIMVVHEGGERPGGMG